MSVSPTDSPRTPQPSIGRAVLVSGGARMAAQAVAWLITLLTVRLLSPADYGKAGLAMTVMTMASLVVDLGLGPAIQAMPDQSASILRHAHSVAALTASVVAGLLALSAPSLAEFFGDPDLRALFLGAAIGILLEGLRAVPQAHALRTFQFTLVARADFLRALAASGVSIALASTGFGPWSIVGGALASSMIGLVVLQWTERLPLAIPSIRDVRHLLAYGRLLAVGRTTWEVWMNADLLIISRLGSMTAAGNFNLAKTFAHLPQDKLLSVLMSVMQSYLATSADDRSATRRYFLDLTELIALAMGLPLLGLLATAPDVLPVMLGPQWGDMASLVRWLIPGVLLYCIGDLANKVVIAGGRAAIPTAASVVAAVIALPWFWLCHHLGGATGVAIGTLAIALLINGPGLVAAVRHTGATSGELARALRPLGLSGAAMMTAIGVADATLSVLPSVSPALRAILLIGVGGLVGPVVAVRVGGPATQQLWASVRRRIRLRSAAQERAD